MMLTISSTPRLVNRNECMNKTAVARPPWLSPSTVAFTGYTVTQQGKGVTDRCSIENSKCSQYYLLYIDASLYLHLPYIENDDCSAVSLETAILTIPIRCISVL